MLKRIGTMCCIIGLLWISSNAADVGAALFRLGKHVAHINVPLSAVHLYFGHLEGPTIENQRCAYRTYVDTANRNSVDFVTKFSPVPILQYFTDTAADEHTLWTWGTDCFGAGQSIGLGGFRLFFNNQWVNPKLGHNLDSLVIDIIDSSTLTPKTQITYYGWNIGNGLKLTSVTWTMSTTFSERPMHCEVTINGTYPGKVVIGIINNNKVSHPVTVIKDSVKVLLATIGKQGGLSEGYTDTLVLAVHADKSYFSSFSDSLLNYGMVLTPDANNKVKWDVAYSEAREPTPIFRNANWQDLLFATTGIAENNRQVSSPAKNSITRTNSNLTREFYTMSGRKIAASSLSGSSAFNISKGIYLERLSDGSWAKRFSSLK